MRNELIVKDAVPGEVALELPEPCAPCYPTGGTSLSGPVRDEADVDTLLARLGDLGLSVVEMRRLPDQKVGGESPRDSSLEPPLT